MSSAIRTPVVQFGTSRFLQAHADLFIHEAKAGPITVAASSGSAAGRARLAALAAADGFPVTIRGRDKGRIVDRTLHVKSIARAIDAADDWAELTRIFVEDAEFVISNTTEAGFAVPDGLRLHLGRPIETAPAGFPARLLALLGARFAAGAKGLTVLPTELVGRNGETLRAIVLDLAKASGGSDALLAYIAEDCVFANSLVDRIVSSPIEPAGAIAEPYALWAIERRVGLALPCEHPAIRLVDDLEPVERLKIHILNLGHTVLAEHWQREGLAPDATVRGLLADPGIQAMLSSVFEAEVFAGFAAHAMGPEAVAYGETTLERFANPFLDHRLSDIATGHIAKVQRRIGGFLDWADAAGAPPMPRLAAIAKRYGAGMD